MKKRVTPEDRKRRASLLIDRKPQRNVLRRIESRSLISSLRPDFTRERFSSFVVTREISVAAALSAAAASGASATTATATNANVRQCKVSEIIGSAHFLFILTKGGVCLAYDHHSGTVKELLGCIAYWMF